MSFFEVNAIAEKVFFPQKKVLAGVTIAVMILQMGLRWETGSDWLPYLDHFENHQVANFFFDEEYPFEAGYNFMVSTLKIVNKSYSFFLFVHAIIFFFLVSKSYSFFTPYIATSLLLFYVSLLGIWGSNRQLIAVAFGLVALQYAYKKKIYYFLAFVFIAYLFHSTSVLLLIFYFINRKLSDKIIILLLLVCFVIGQTQIPYLIFSAFGGINARAEEKTMLYLENAQENAVALNLLGLAKRIILFAIFYLNRKKINAIFPKYNFLFNGYFIGVLFYLIFHSSLLVMISRGSIYFNILEPILISLQLFLYRDWRKIVLLFIIIIYCIVTLNQSIAPYPELFVPYKGIFINSDIHRQMF